ncbi:hypothetical protein DZG02_17270 [Clavibacter lycopersici]|nr:hypothetical protein DZG02_17270 [Clavibacter lycopersici]
MCRRCRTWRPMTLPRDPRPRRRRRSRPVRRRPRACRGLRRWDVMPRAQTRTPRPPAGRR